MTPYQPLAEQLRPTTLDDFVGQQHLLYKEAPLYQAIVSGKPHSMIFWGPPGVGKTTLAHIIAAHANAEIEMLSAVLAGVKDIRALITAAEKNRDQGRLTCVFVDEVHRFNKSQQDAFLPHVESGLLIFIGATTENPSFEVNNALLSRAQVYTLELLSDLDLIRLIEKAIEVQPVAYLISDNAKQQLAKYADGDARRLLNSLEQLFAAQPKGEITSDTIKALLKNTLLQFDKNGENFYHQISALHKSVRGSNPDAALYWFARMITAGCDPLYIARRVVRMASEDIGNADPRALDLALNAWQTQERLGSPEGDLTIAQAIVYCAVAPKSNAVYLAYKKALELAKNSGSLPVPLHLKNAPTQLMRELDYGTAYRYDHDEPEAYAIGQQYLPPQLQPQKLYLPTERGLEKKIKQKLDHLATLKAKQ